MMSQVGRAISRALRKIKIIYIKYQFVDPFLRIHSKLATDSELHLYIRETFNEKDIAIGIFEP